jgi:[ribosomal protein S5]-alanine N-acetyltransferase
MTLVLRPVAGEPELSDPAITGAFAQQMAALAATPQVEPWCGFIGWRGDIPVGFGGFTAVPDPAGVTEVGYLTFPAHERTGVASAVCAGLVAIARNSGATALIAHTLPSQGASTRVLAKCGFARDGVAIDPDEGEVWRWRLVLTSV